MNGEIRPGRKGSTVSWKNYGIKQEFVDRVKTKMKNDAVKERIKMLLDGVTKYDLQDRAKVKRLVKAGAKIVNEPLTDALEDQLTDFVISQRIDPRNTLHLIKLWAMFR